MRIQAAPRILVVAGICCLALIGVVVSEGAARAGGQEVLLPMEAVDPRAILSGHYVEINLMQRLAPTEACPTEGEDDWVALRQDGDRYVAAGGAMSREAAELIGLPVKGTLNCAAPTPPAPGLEQGAPGWISMQLGIERFHINQADAMRIERVLAERVPGGETRAYAIVSVGRDGRARLKGLMVDGERLELSWL